MVEAPGPGPGGAGPRLWLYLTALAILSGGAVATSLEQLDRED